MAKRIVVGIVLGLALSGVVSGIVAFAATVAGGNLTVSRSFVTVNGDGSASIGLSYATPSGRVIPRTLFVDAACTRVVDDKGATVANPAPVSLCTDISTFASDLDGLIATGAAGGKLGL